MTTSQKKKTGFTARVHAVRKTLRLDSHHSAERFGVIVGAVSLAGVLMVGGSAVSAYTASQAQLADQSIYTSTFTTSKTGLNGEVTGLYSNTENTKVLVMMRFDPQAPISYNAEDYRAFLMGSGLDFSTEDLATDGLSASFYVMGSTGYMGVLLEADEPFAEQVMNLTMRSNKELTRPTDGSTAPSELSDDEVAIRGGDSSFEQYDQWRLFINPGASGVIHLDALDAAAFDPAQAYYDVVVKSKESDLRKRLDAQLDLMRSDLQRIDSYENDLATTKVDGLFLRPPAVPSFIDGDQVVGESAAESGDDTSTLALDTNEVATGGFNFDWRNGNVYDGYLKDLVPAGQSTSEYLNERNNQDVAQTGANSADSAVSQMSWTLSDGSSLTDDYRAGSRSMQPLTTVMNNLSGAYQSYSEDKTAYQTGLLNELLNLDVELRGVESNASVNTSSDFLTY